MTGSRRQTHSRHGHHHRFSIAFHIAKVAPGGGRRTGPHRVRPDELIRRIADRLPNPAPLIELDVQNEEHLSTRPTASSLRSVRATSSTAWSTRSATCPRPAGGSTRSSTLHTKTSPRGSTSPLTSVRVAGQRRATDHEPGRRHRRHGLRPDPRNACLGQLDDG